MRKTHVLYQLIKKLSTVQQGGLFFSVYNFFLVNTESPKYFRKELRKVAKELESTETHSAYSFILIPSSVFRTLFCLSNQ